MVGSEKCTSPWTLADPLLSIHFKGSPQIPAAFVCSLLPLHSTTEQMTLNSVYCHIFLSGLRLDIEETYKQRRPA